MIHNLDTQKHKSEKEKTGLLEEKHAHLLKSVANVKNLTVCLKLTSQVLSVKHHSALTELPTTVISIGHFIVNIIILLKKLKEWQ